MAFSNGYPRSFFAATYSGFITDQSVIRVWGDDALLLSTLPLCVGLIRFVEIVMHPDKYKVRDATESMVGDKFLGFVCLVYVAIMLIGRLNV